MTKNKNLKGIYKNIKGGMQYEKISFSDRFIYLNDLNLFYKNIKNNKTIGSLYNQNNLESKNKVRLGL